MLEKQKKRTAGTQEEKTQERDKRVEAYRAKYGQLEGGSDLLTRHQGWQEEDTAFISPDGVRFLKNKCTLNKERGRN